MQHNPTLSILPREQGTLVNVRTGSLQALGRSLSAPTRTGARPASPASVPGLGRRLLLLQRTGLSGKGSGPALGLGQQTDQKRGAFWEEGKAPSLQARGHLLDDQQLSGIRVRCK